MDDWRSFLKAANANAKLNVPGANERARVGKTALFAQTTVRGR